MGKKILIVSLGVLLFIALLTFVSLNLYRGKTPVLAPASPSPSVNNVLNLKKLSFTPPAGWWYKSGHNQWLETDFFELDKDNPGDPYEFLPAFVFSVSKVKNTTLVQEKNKLVSTWHLKKYGETNIQISNNIGILMQGECDPGKVQSPTSWCGRINYQKPGKIALFVVNDEVYTLIGDVEKYDKEFGEIVATIKFNN